MSKWEAREAKALIATRACEASSVSGEFVPEEQVIAIGIGSGNFSLSLGAGKATPALSSKSSVTDIKIASRVLKKFNG